MAAISLGSLVVDLIFNHASFVEGASKASYVANKAGKDIEKSFSQISTAAESALAPFGDMGETVGLALDRIGHFAARGAEELGKFGKTAGILGAVGGIAGGALAAVGVTAVGMAVHTSEAADHMYHLSEATGISVETLSAFEYVAKETDLDMETMTLGLERLSRSAFQAATAPVGTINAYTRLGISVKDSAGHLRPVDKLFADVADRFQKMPDGIAKTALAIQIFGRYGAQLVPALDQGRAGIEDLLKTAQALGIVMDKQTAAAAHEFHTQLNQIEATAQGLGLTLLRRLLPAVQTLAGAFLGGMKNSNSALHELIGAAADFAEILLATGDTAWTVMKQIGIFLGDLVGEIVQVAEAAGRIADAFAHMDFSGMWHAAQDGAARTKAVFDQFITDSKKDWKDYMAFTAGLVGKPKLPKEEGGAGAKGPQIVTTGGQLAGVVTDQVTKLIAKYQAAAAAQLNLLAVTDKSAASLSLYRAAAAADVEIERTRAQILDQIHEYTAELGNAEKSQQGAEIAQYTARIAAYKQQLVELDKNRAAIRALAEETAAAEASTNVAKALHEATGAINDQVAAADNLHAAWMTGGEDAAELVTKTEAQRRKIDDLRSQYDQLSKTPGANGAALKALAAAIDDATTKLDAYSAAVKRQQQTNIAADVDRATVALRAQIAEWNANAKAAFGDADAQRAAAGAAAVAAYAIQHSAATTAELARVRENALRQYDLEGDKSTQQLALQNDILNNYASQLSDLQDAADLLEQEKRSTIGIRAAMADLNAQTAKQLDDLAARFGNLREKVGAFLDELRLQGDYLGAKIFDSLQKTLADTESEIAHFVVTGKANFRELLDSLNESVMKATMQKAIGGIATSIEARIGLKMPGMGKRDGSSPGAALFVTPTSGSLGGLGKLGSGGDEEGGGKSEGTGGMVNKISGGFKSIGSKLEGTMSKIFSSISAIFSKLVGSMGSILGSIGKIFGGFLAGGGAVTPGKAYIVGEHHPEFFVPHQPGQVAPALALGGRHQTVLNFHVHGVQDVDSFRRSQGQVMALMQNQLALAYTRNR